MTRAELDRLCRILVDSMTPAEWVAFARAADWHQREQDRCAVEGLIESVRREPRRTP